MLRQATLNETLHTLYSNHLGEAEAGDVERNVNTLNAEAGDVERNVTHTLLESFRSFNPPNAEAGDVERNVSTRII